MTETLCRCEATTEALTELGFTVEVRVHSMGSWHVVRAGLRFEEALDRATVAGLVRLLCVCGRERAEQEAHQAWVASGSPCRRVWRPEFVEALLELGAVTAEWAAEVREAAAWRAAA
jgi:hypothetical protein